MEHPEASRRNRSGKKVSCLLLALLPLLASTFWYWGVRSKDLLATSTTFYTREPYENPKALFVQGWLSEQSVLLSQAQSGDEYKCYALDTHTRRLQELPDLSASVHQAHVLPGSISPDGLWLVCYPLKPTSKGMIDYWQLEVNGRRRFRLRLSLSCEFAWSSDSKMCVGWGAQDFTIIKWPVATSGPVKPIDTWPGFRFANAEPWEAKVAVLGATADALILIPDVVTPPRMQLDELTLSLPPIRRRMASLALNSVLDLGAYDVRLSPDACHLAYVVHHEAGRPGPPWLQRIKQLVGIKDSRYATLWTSRIDGSNQREIGHLPDLPGFPEDKSIGGWGWDFHGRALWFEYNNRYLRTPPIY